MRVKPNENYQLANIPESKLNKDIVYNAVIASNQPDYKEKGLIFVKDILLDKTEYIIIK